MPLQFIGFTLLGNTRRGVQGQLGGSAAEGVQRPAVFRLARRRWGADFAGAPPFRKGWEILFACHYWQVARHGEGHGIPHELPPAHHNAR